MIVSYGYIFQVGQNEHRVRIYESYSRELGLHGKVLFEMESTRKNDIFKKLKNEIDLTDVQWETLKNLAKDKCHHMVVLPDGTRHSY